MKKVEDTPKGIMRQLVLGRIVSDNLYVFTDVPTKELCNDLHVQQLLRFNKQGDLETCYPLKDNFIQKNTGFFIAKKGLKWHICLGADLRNWFAPEK